MRTYFLLLVTLLFSSCEVKEIDPTIFENYFFGEGSYSLKIEDFYGHYKISKAGINLPDTDNYSKGRNYGEHPNQFSFSKENGKYFLEYPLPAVRDRQTSKQTTGFYIVKTEINLNNFQIGFKNEFNNNGNGIPAIANGKGILNKEKRVIELKIEYFHGDQVFNFNTQKYENVYKTEPDLINDYLYKFYSKL